jgi:hypothetical protein
MPVQIDPKPAAQELRDSLYAQALTLRMLVSALNDAGNIHGNSQYRASDDDGELYARVDAVISATQSLLTEMARDVDASANIADEISIAIGHQAQAGAR